MECLQHLSDLSSFGQLHGVYRRVLYKPERIGEVDKREEKERQKLRVENGLGFTYTRLVIVAARRDRKIICRGGVVPRTREDTKPVPEARENG